MAKEHFLGTFNHTLDAKGRVSVPARFRDILKNFYRSMEVVLIKRDGSITVFPYDEWEKFVEKTQALAQTSRKNRDYQRRLFANASEVEIDKSGRIKISDSLIKSLKIDKELVLVGVQNRFEIWDKTEWEIFERGDEVDGENIPERAFKVYEGGRD